PIGEGVLVRIRDCLGDEQPERYRELRPDYLARRLDDELDVSAARQSAPAQFGTKVFEEPVQIAFLQALRFVQASMQSRERVDAAASFCKRLSRARIADAPCVQVQQAHHELQVVLHAMMDFTNQELLLRERIAQLRFAR